MSWIGKLVAFGAWKSDPVYSTDEREVEYNPVTREYRWRRRTALGVEPFSWRDGLPGDGAEAAARRLNSINALIGDDRPPAFGKRSLENRPASARPINPAPIKQVVLSLMPAGGVILSELLPGAHLPEVQIKSGTLPECANAAIINLLDAREERLQAELVDLGVTP